MDKLSQIALFDQVARQWDALHPVRADKLRCLAELAAPTPGARILSVGCGTGSFESFLLQKDPEYLLAIDFSPRMIDVAREKLDDPRIELRCCDVLDLTDGEFDFAFVHGTFQQFENRGSLFRQMARLLKTGGRLVICHSEGRSMVNSHYDANAAELVMPLPAAHTLGGTLSQYFDVDVVIDTQDLYVVSGMLRRL